MSLHFKGIPGSRKKSGSAAGRTDPFHPRALLACSLIFGWVLAYFFNTSAWDALAGAEAESARLFFFGGQLLGMFAGLSLMRRSNVKAMVAGCAAAALAAILVLRILPSARAGGWGYGLFGILAGGAYGGMFHYWIFAFAGVPRVAVIAAVHLAGGVVSLGILWAGRLFGTAGAASADVMIVLAAVWAARGVDMGRVDDPGRAELLPFPGRLLVVVIIAILILYFSSFLPEGLLAATGEGVWPLPNPELRFLVSSAVYALFVLAGGGVHVLALLYAAILLELAGFGLIMLHAGALAGPVLLVLADAAGNLFLFTLAFDIYHKHRRRPMIGALFAGTVVVGTALGMLLGKVLDALGLSRPGAFVGMMVVFYSGILALVPLLLRVLERELSLRGRPRSSPAAPEAEAMEEENTLAFLDPAYLREPMGRKIRRLNQRFDAPYRLTVREIEIAALLAGRLDYETIARRLSISINTLKVHAKSVYRKFDVPGRKGLIELCLEPDREPEEHAAEA